ncbi:50S ribosomal protein L37ae [Candidatus Woesearchaeota archaeon]|nr:50S ribosomal protein L37ae [Candidatus Woesearchaeota archaeon]
MASKELNLASAKRFGARYGPRIRNKVAEIELSSRGWHKCPYCSRQQVKRVAIGIFSCRKCNETFTGKAYGPIKKIITKTETLPEEETPAEEEE